MRFWERMDETIGRLEKAIMVLFLGLMIVTAFAQIALRNFVGIGLPWSEPLVRYLVLWVGFIGASLAAREGRHITIEVIKLPENVPAVVYESFLSLSPLFFLVLAFWVIRFVLGVDIDHLVQTAFRPLVFALNTLPGILVYAFLVTLLWSVGINGDNAMDAIVAPIFLQYLAANVEAMTAGQPLPYVTAYGFFTALGESYKENRRLVFHHKNGFCSFRNVRLG